MGFLGRGDFRAEGTRACSEAAEMEPEERKKAEIQGRARTVVDHVLLRGWTGLHIVGSGIARGGLPLTWCGKRGAVWGRRYVYRR